MCFVGTESLWDWAGQKSLCTSIYRQWDSLVSHFSNLPPYPTRLRNTCCGSQECYKMKACPCLSFMPLLLVTEHYIGIPMCFSTQRGWGEDEGQLTSSECCGLSGSARCSGHRNQKDANENKINGILLFHKAQFATGDQ